MIFFQSALTSGIAAAGGACTESRSARRPSSGPPVALRGQRGERPLEVQLGEQGRRTLDRQGTRDPVAYDYYRRGRYLWSTRTREGHRTALEHFERAIERDSSYAEPYAGLADVYLTGYQLGLADMPEAEVYSRLKWAAERALALDDRSTSAHTSFAIALWWQRNWPARPPVRAQGNARPGHPRGFASGGARAAERTIRRRSGLRARRGEADSAFVWLERCPWRWPNTTVRADPGLDSVRSDPRFAQLVRRVDREMGLQ